MVFLIMSASAFCIDFEETSAAGFALDGPVRREAAQHPAQQARLCHQAGAATRRWGESLAAALQSSCNRRRGSAVQAATEDL